MPWCPVCKTEYKEGVTTCVDCGETLVSALSQEENAEEAWDQEAFDAEEYEEDEDEDTEEKIERRQPASVYRKQSERAEEFKSSGYILLLVGGLGLLLLLLIDFGIVPIHLNNEVMMNIVMAALFVFFIVFGILSLRSAKKYQEAAQKEEALTAEIGRWIRENVTAKELDEGLPVDEPEAVLYFKRYERLKQRISDKYMNLDEAFLDMLAEESYQTLYDQEA